MNSMAPLSLVSLAALLGASGLWAGDISGQVIDAQTSDPVARARVTVHSNVAGGPGEEVVLLTDAAGTFTARNMPDGAVQISCQKAEYLASSASAMAIGGDRDSRPPAVVLRLTRQAVVEGSVVDESGIGVSSALVRLIQYRVTNGRRRLQSGFGSQTDETGAFRMFGLPAGHYYLGVTAQFQRRRNPNKLVYAPMLYPDSTDVNGAQAIDLQPGTEEHIQLRLRPVPGHEVRGRIVPGGHPSFSLHAQDQDRFPLDPMASWNWDEKTDAFTIPGLPEGIYVLDVTTELEGIRRRALKPVTITDTDRDGILIEPGSIPEVVGRTLLDGREVGRGPLAQVGLQSPHGYVGGQIEEDGRIRFANVAPGSYRLIVNPAASYYIQSILLGGRDVLHEEISITDNATAPLEVNLGSRPATIEGVLAVPVTDYRAPIMVALFRRIDTELVFEKQQFVAAAVGPSGQPNLPRFTLASIAPGDYLLFAWPSDAQIEYAAPDFSRLYGTMGQPVSVAEGARMTVVVDRLAAESQTAKSF